MKRIVISKDAVYKNIELLQKKVGKAEIYAVLKSNAYGYDLKQMAEILSQNGIHRFAVTEPKDALRLRKWGFVDEEILIIRSTSNEDDIKDIIAASATASIGSYDAAVSLNKLAEEAEIVCDAHVKIDTGLGRYGFAPDDFDRIISVFRFMPNINITGTFSHYADVTNKSYTQQQFNTFMSVIAKIRDAGFDPGMLHIDASGSVCKGHTDILDAVRAGSALTGNNPIVKASGFLPVSTYETSISEIRWFPKGQCIGYGGAFITKRPTRVAYIPIGYYDSFSIGRLPDVFTLRSKLGRLRNSFYALFKNQSLYVSINGKKARVLGHLGMNHAAVDITDIDCNIGTTVVLPTAPFYVTTDVPRVIL